MRLLLLALVVLTASTAHAQLLLREDFAYPVGSDLTSVSSWVAHSGAGSVPIKVVAQNLSFASYRASAGNAVYVTGGAGSREDVNRSFTSVSAGNVYAAFLARVDSAGTDGDYFFHLGPDPVSTTFRGRLFTRDQGNGFQFGITKAAGAGTSVVWDPTTYTFTTTYLIVVRYSIIAGDANDTVDLFVIKPGSSATVEPATPSASASDVSGTDIAPGTVSFRQAGSGTPLQPYGITVDGIRVSQTFAGLSTAVELDLVAHNARLSLRGAQPSVEAHLQLQADVTSSVQVRAYDALGREVATLFDGTLGVGDTRDMVLRGVPAGVYIVRAVGANLSASRTVVLQ